MNKNKESNNINNINVLSEATSSNNNKNNIISEPPLSNHNYFKNIKNSASESANSKFYINSQLHDINSTPSTKQEHHTAALPLKDSNYNNSIQSSKSQSRSCHNISKLETNKTDASPNLNTNRNDKSGVVSSKNKEHKKSSYLSSKIKGIKIGKYIFRYV